MQVDAKQEEGRTNNNQQLEDISLVNQEGTAIEKQLKRNLVATTLTITDVEKANYEFDQTNAENSNYRHQITKQINDIEYLMRMLNNEISQ